MSKKITISVSTLGVNVATEGEFKDLIEVAVVMEAAMAGIRNEMMKNSRISPIVTPGPMRPQ